MTTPVTPTHNTNLPQMLTSFIGRERELAEVRQRLSETRLVTLTGPGGTGKTRLALEVARSVLELFQEGVWLVELATVMEGESVLQVVASTLGVREEADRSLIATLTDYLRPRNLLLVLDNCEHVLSICSQLAHALLRSAPNLQILATSRQAFGLEGECVWKVQPLSLPDSEQSASYKELAGSEAVRLFVDRARLRRNDFVLSPEEVPLVAALCRQLDGLPLAIELAAARTRALSVEQLASRLDERFRLLAATADTVEPRHRTLSALMDWSYDLLSPQEQTLLRQISVFAGAFTLEAVRAVCHIGPGGGSIGETVTGTAEEWEAIESISQLVDKSLVTVEEQGGQAHYRMLETIREYAWEKLQASGDTVELRNRHLRYYLSIAEQSQDELLGENQRLWLDRLEREHDNLRAALAWSRSDEVEPLVSLRLAGALAWFWYFRGYLTEGRTELENALHHAETELGELSAFSVRGVKGETVEANRQMQLVELAKVLTASGTLAFLQGDYSHSQRRLEQSLGIWRQLKDARGTAFALTFLARLAKRNEDPACKSLVEESVELFRQAGEKWGLALSLVLLSEVAHDEGEAGRAASLHQESLALYQELGHAWGVALELSSAGQAAMQRGDYIAARGPLEKAVAIQRNVGDKWTLAWTLRSLAGAVRAVGDYQRARALHQESLVIFDELQDREGIALATEDLSSLTSLMNGSVSEAEVPPSEQLNSSSADGGLTKREVEVLRLLAEGLADAQIAERLSVSVRTVNAHVRSIYSKVGVATRSAATRYAIQHRIL